MFTGSPPHTRGKASAFCFFWMCFRITPAYTGKRRSFDRPCNLREDHPRIHVEKKSKKYGQSVYIGSPPHTRGKVAVYCCQDMRHRITPAYTGKSFRSIALFIIVKDHPRIHGEKKLKTGCGSQKLGSPPHTRGKVEFLCVFFKVLRITPAYTGKSIRKS